VNDVPADIREKSAGMFFFAPADTGTPERLPLMTIPAQ